MTAGKSPMPRSKGQLCQMNKPMPKETRMPAEVSIWQLATMPPLSLAGAISDRYSDDIIIEMPMPNPAMNRPSIKHARLSGRTHYIAGPMPRKVSDMSITGFLPIRSAKVPEIKAPKEAPNKARLTNSCFQFRVINSGLSLWMNINTEAIMLVSQPWQKPPRDPARPKNMMRQRLQGDYFMFRWMKVFLECYRRQDRQYYSSMLFINKFKVLFTL